MAGAPMLNQYLLGVAKQRSSAARTVLRKANSTAGGKTIRSVDQILTSKQRKDLHADLSEMARRRREAEASSGNLRLS